MICGQFEIWLCRGRNTFDKILAGIIFLVTVGEKYSVMFL